MEVTYAALTTAGPVRENNEDYVAFWQPGDGDDKLRRGVVMALADGVGGHGHGEVASRLAAETAVQAFKDSKADVAPRSLLTTMFSVANTAVYDEGMKEGATGGRMSTTLTIVIFRHSEATIGHVGDCRTYLVRGGTVRCLTSDHSYAGLQQKLGLLTAEEARASEFKSVLTRSIGQDLVTGPDLESVLLNQDDILVQCTDGLHGSVPEDEIAEAVILYKPKDACRYLISLAEKRGTQDNTTVQIARVDKISPVAYHRNLPYAINTNAQEVPMGHEVQIGQVLDDRFQITDVISRSGMASIFKAIDRTNQKVVALKVPLMQYESDPASFSRFEREEEIGLTLDHPSILRLLKVEKKSRPYIAMEFLEGQTLGKLMRAVRPMPEADAIKLASRLADALDYLHRRRMNIIHRDLKPDNIMVCNDGSLRIMDFGIAKATGLRRITFGGFSPTMGTPDYMAPEQVKGQRGDERTDIYSLGAILYEMVTGKVPFEGDNAYTIMNARLAGDPIAPRKVNQSLSPQVEEIVLHAMARNPNERYDSAAQMKEELDHLDKVQVTGRDQRLQAPKPASVAWQANRLLILALLVPVVILIVFMLLFPRH